MIKKNLIKVLALSFFVYFLISSCVMSSRGFVKNPIDSLITALYNEPDYSIILHDMDYNEASDNYRHKYQLVIAKSSPDTVLSELTEWKPVSDELFNEHIDNLGMELATKKNGVLKKAVAPAGYSNYIGNEKYGQWNQQGGSSFWEFYGKYAMLSSIFYMVSSPVRYSYWNDYHRNYRPYGRSYYGSSSSGSRMYGTNSVTSRTNFKNRNWNTKTSSFKNRVRSRVQQSASRSRESRISRSSNRFSTSGSRSRSGGFGK